MTPSAPCCAHIRVSYQTETLPNFGTHGWWACDACGKRFAPISNTLSDGETVRPVDAGAGINRASDLRRAAGLREAARQQAQSKAKLRCVEGWIVENPFAPEEEWIRVDEFAARGRAAADLASKAAHGPRITKIDVKNKTVTFG